MRITLSGWHRLGVVFSVIWLISIFGAVTFERLKGEPHGEGSFVEFVPDPSGKVITITDPHDGKTSSLRPVKAAIRMQYTLIIAFVPLLLGWLSVYLVGWTVRWIWQGFRRDKKTF